MGCDLAVVLGFLLLAMFLFGTLQPILAESSTRCTIEATTPDWQSIDLI